MIGKFVLALSLLLLTGQAQAYQRVVCYAGDKVVIDIVVTERVFFYNNNSRLSINEKKIETTLPCVVEYISKESYIKRIDKQVYKIGDDK